jgi:hypothetical protein
MLISCPAIGHQANASTNNNDLHPIDEPGTGFVNFVNWTCEGSSNASIKNDGLRAGESFASTDTDPFDREFHCSSVQRSALNHVERSQQRCGM